MAHRDLLKYSDLITDLHEGEAERLALHDRLAREGRRPRARQGGCLIAHHVFPSGHQPLVDDLGGVVPPCIDVYTFFND